MVVWPIRPAREASTYSTAEVLMRRSSGAAGSVALLNDMKGMSGLLSMSGNAKLFVL
jgi:hypothetical protein